MKFKFLYTIPLIILCLLGVTKISIAKEFIGKVVSVDKNNTEITVEIYNNSQEGFSWAKLFGFENQNNKVPKIVNIKINKNKINKISQGSFLRLIGKFKKNKKFLLKKLQVLPRDPTGVRERLGLIRHQRRTRSHRTRPAATMHIHRAKGNRHR